MKSYFLALTAAAIFCGIMCTYFPTGGPSGKLIRLLAGILLILTVLKPVSSADLLHTFTQWSITMEADGAAQSAQGKEMAYSAMADIIKAQSEAYILDEAKQLGLELIAEVTVGGEELPRPVSVRLVGKAAPYAKAKLQQLIQENLEIAKEDQKWVDQA